VLGYSTGVLMKYLVILIFCNILSFQAICGEATDMDWNGLSKEKIELKLPLLIIKGSKGLLACGYIDVNTCNKTEEACAIVSGVKTHDDMLHAQVKAVSDAAEAMGVQVGMKGMDVLNLMR
jgi:uncharacterized protein YunC (DUF1805 family)